MSSEAQQASDRCRPFGFLGAGIREVLVCEKDEGREEQDGVEREVGGEGEEEGGRENGACCERRRRRAM